MLKHLMNDVAVLKSVQNADEYDIPTITELKSIKCRIEFAVKSEQTSISINRNKPARMYCYDEVNVGDIISYNFENFEVIQVNVYKDLDGNNSLREVYLV